MARSKQQNDRANQKKLERRRHQLDKRAKTVANGLPLSNLVALHRIIDLIDDGELDEAEELLVDLDRRYPNRPEVLERLFAVFVKLERPDDAAYSGYRLIQTGKCSDEMFLAAARSIMSEGHVVTANQLLHRFVELHSENKSLVAVAQRAITVMEEAVAAQLDRVGAFAEQSTRLCSLHEVAILSLRAGAFTTCEEKCRALVQEFPTFTRARNNLALALFYQGKTQEATDVAIESCAVAEDKSFALALAAKLSYLQGDQATAERLADGITTSPPTEEDSIVASLELLALMGRDDDVRTLIENCRFKKYPKHTQAHMLHFEAYVEARRQNFAEAKKLWKSCVASAPNHAEARGNLSELSADGTYSPWVITGSVLGNLPVFSELRNLGHRQRLSGRQVFQSVQYLIPIMLDRFEPRIRQIALNVLLETNVPSSIAMLKEFALGCRGTDEERFKALYRLQELGEIKSRRLQFFVKGKWQEVLINSPRISFEPEKSDYSEEILQLLKEASDACSRCEYDEAERRYQTILEEMPEDCRTRHNLCTVWMNRDGQSGYRRALPVLEKIFEEHPDYAFVRLSLANFALKEGDLQRARDLIEPILDLGELHFTLAKSLFSTQARIALAHGNTESAEAALELLKQVSSEDDPVFQSVRADIDRKTRSRNGLFRRLLFNRHLSD